MGNRTLGPWTWDADRWVRRCVATVKAIVAMKHGMHEWLVWDHGNDGRPNRSDVVYDLTTAQAQADAAAVALGWTLAEATAIEESCRHTSLTIKGNCMVCGIVGPSKFREYMPTPPFAAPTPPIPTGPLCLLTATGARACAGDPTLRKSRDTQPLTDRPEDVTCPGCAPFVPDAIEAARPPVAFDRWATACAADARPLPGRRPWGARWERP